jgi:sugar/nucleoside kinase (ribokinase family)
MEEALRLSGAASVDAAIDFFKTSGVGAAIITHGSNPLYFFADNSLFGTIPQTTLPVSERVLAELRKDAQNSGDTTGCGDNFAGGVIASVAGQLVKKPDSPVDLTIAIALGVASGGYACFYNGGTFYESFPGQKAQLVDAYYQEYLTQIGLRKLV